jgi:5-bromo-4-chloroindolyl phosphate hydrolysis protein
MDFRNILLIIALFFGISFLMNYYSEDTKLTKKRMKEIEYGTNDYKVTCALPHYDPKV